MAQLFIQDESNVWSVFELASDAYRLSVPPRTGSKSAAPPSTDHLRLSVVESAGAERLSEAGALLLSGAGREGTQAAPEPPSSPEAWAVLAGTDTRLRINGVPVSVGIATLRHRDELCLDGSAPLYFSTERLVSIETYRREDSPRCPRCTLSIELNDAYVCCPGCGVLHHQLPDRECWTYTPTCALCDQSSDLEAGYRWSPEVL
jgi:hypothetical protein